MPEQPSLQGPLAKLRRARHHLETLYTDYNRSVGPESYTLAPEDGKKPRSQIWKIEGLPDLDADWGLIVGDFAQNLRSALDHLVWQLVIVSGAKPGGDNQFPICTTGTRYWCARKDGTPSVRDRMLRGVSDEHRTSIDAVQPYRTGEDPKSTFLAGLNDLSNFDKHRVVQAAFRATLEPSQEDFDLISADEHAFVQVTTTPGARLENGAQIMETEIVTSDPDAKVQMKADLPAAVGFGETGIRIDGLGPLYEWVRDFIRSFTPAF